MKKLFYLLLLLPILFVSCDDDEDNTSTNLTINDANVIGEWEYFETIADGEISNSFSDFLPNSFNLMANGVCSIEGMNNSGTWAVVGSTLNFGASSTTMTSSETITVGESFEAPIKRLTNTQAVFNLDFSALPDFPVTEADLYYNKK